MVKIIFLFIMTIFFSGCVGREIVDGVNSRTSGGNKTGVSMIDHTVESRSGDSGHASYCFLKTGCVCMDLDSYPNIGQAFRGYDLALGDPLATVDHGYLAHIFDEATERNAEIMFGNVAGHDMNRCNGQIHSTFISNAEELMDSTISSSTETESYSIGPEMTVSVSAEYKGVEAEAEMDIPPVYQASSSNTETFGKLSTGLESSTMSMVKSTFSCYEYSFNILDYQHPVFTPQFKSAVEDLATCKSNRESNSLSEDDLNACVKEFFSSYGTHYIAKAVFGSRLITTKMFKQTDTLNEDSSEAIDCAESSETWSALGTGGKDTSSSKCLELSSSQASLNKYGIGTETIITIGSRPKDDYVEWAEQTGSPEIIQKHILPISYLFTKHFMEDMTMDKTYGAMRTWLEDDVIPNYCKYFANEHRCNHVTKMYMCPQNTPGCGSTLDCGEYTGPVKYDSATTNFRPHGLGSFTILDGTSKVSTSYAWDNGCPEGIPDPCSANSNPCGTNADCVNEDGIAKCSCTAGFEGDPLDECIDVTSSCSTCYAQQGTNTQGNCRTYTKNTARCVNLAEEKYCSTSSSFFVPCTPKSSATSDTTLIKGPQGDCPSNHWSVDAAGRELQNNWACCSKCPGSKCYNNCGCLCSQAKSCEGIVNRATCLPSHGCQWDGSKCLSQKHLGDCDEPYFKFYTGNNIAGSEMCQVSLNPKSGNNALVYPKDEMENLGCSNDDAKSMHICCARKGTTITVYDDGNLRSNEDDYAIITIKEDLNMMDQNCISINTFETNNCGNVACEIEYPTSGNLDGKVSSFKVEFPDQEIE